MSADATQPHPMTEPHPVSEPHPMTEPHQMMGPHQMMEPQGPVAAPHPGSDADGHAAQRPAHAVLSRRLPPVAELAVASVALMLASGVYLAAHLPTPPPLTPAVVLCTVGAALSVGAIALLGRIRPFAWDAFFLVARWALVAYMVIAGLLAFVFIFDHTRGATLGVLIASLVVFALDVPVVIAFTVARYHRT